MIREERLLKVVRAPHVSEKASTAMEKTNTIVLKVAKDATKAEIVAAVEKLFEVEVKDVNTLVVKGKVKRHGQRIGRRSDWKKAYVTLKEGPSLQTNFVDCELDKLKIGQKVKVVFKPTDGAPLPFFTVA